MHKEKVWLFWSILVVYWCRVPIDRFNLGVQNLETICEKKKPLKSLLCFSSWSLFTRRDENRILIDVNMRLSKSKRGHGVTQGMYKNSYVPRMASTRGITLKYWFKWEYWRHVSHPNIDKRPYRRAKKMVPIACCLTLSSRSRKEFLAWWNSRFENLGKLVTKIMIALDFCQTRNENISDDVVPNATYRWFVCHLVGFRFSYRHDFSLLYHPHFIFIHDKAWKVLVNRLLINYVYKPFVQRLAVSDYIEPKYKHYLFLDSCLVFSTGILVDLTGRILMKY